MERNGPGLEYKVSWRQRGVETDWNEEMVKKHSLSVRNVPTFVPYEIKVQAVNNLGSGPEPNITIGYSGEDGEWRNFPVKWGFPVLQNAQVGSDGLGSPKLLECQCSA